MGTSATPKLTFSILLFSDDEAQRSALAGVFANSAIDCIITRVTEVDEAMRKLSYPEDYRVAIISAEHNREISGKIFPHDKRYLESIGRLVCHLRQSGHRYSDVPVIITSEDGGALSKLSRLCAFTPAPASVLGNRESCGTLLSAVTGDPRIAKLLNEPQMSAVPTTGKGIPVLQM